MLHSVLMRRISAILLMMLLLSTTEVEQLFRLPLLVEHLVSHIESDERFRVSEFFAIHYLGQDNDSDDQEDSRLPFKTFDGNHLGFVYLGHSPVKLSPFSAAAAGRYRPALGGANLPGYSADIFHPPQTVHTRSEA
ncbi:MAG TPA: hypothetical protein VF145_03755 [Chitinophagaceae bacterium]